MLAVMARAKRKKAKDQHTAFKEAARALDCEQSEAAFERALGKIGRSKPVEKPKKKLRKRSRLALDNV
jgi:hypothetical protein